MCGVIPCAKSGVVPAAKPAAANAAARTNLPLELKLDALLARLDHQLVAALQIHQLEDVLDDVVWKLAPKN